MFSPYGGRPFYEYQFYHNKENTTIYLVTRDCSSSFLSLDVKSAANRDLRAFSLVLDAETMIVLTPTS